MVAPDCPRSPRLRHPNTTQRATRHIPTPTERLIATVPYIEAHKTFTSPLTEVCYPTLGHRCSRTARAATRSRGDRPHAGTNSGESVCPGRDPFDAPAAIIAFGRFRQSQCNCRSSSTVELVQPRRHFGFNAIEVFDGRVRREDGLLRSTDAHGGRHPDEQIGPIWDE